MARFLITLQIGEDTDKKRLAKFLKKKNSHRVMDNVWVATGSDNLRVRDLRESLSKALGKNDRAFVVQFTNKSFQNARAGTNDWFKKY